MNRNLIGIVFAVTATSAPSQTSTAPRLEFDVASIKPSQMTRLGGEGSGRENVAVSPNSVTLSNAGLSFCIQWAYNVRFYQISGPERLISERYDIIAKTEKPSGKDQLRAMMQTLLADRFQLRLHHESRTMPVYELVVPSKSVRFRQSAPDQHSGMSVVNDSFVFRHISMAEFAERLSDFSAFDRRPVLDKTGLEGFFDITLASAARALREDPQSIFSAVEKVGLKLNAHKGSIEVLVVDHADKPSGN